jgi:hypothetical protein
MPTCFRSKFEKQGLIQHAATCRGVPRQKLAWFRSGCQTTSVMSWLLQSGGEMGKQRGVGDLMSEKAETCFVLPLREAVAHFPRWNTRSTDAKMGCSDNGNGLLMRPSTWPQTSEQGFSHFSESMADRFSSKISASSPAPQTEKNAGEEAKSPARGFGLLWCAGSRMKMFELPVKFATAAAEQQVI